MDARFIGFDGNVVLTFSHGPKSRPRVTGQALELV